MASVLTLMFHSIVEEEQLKTSDNWSYSYAKFQELCQFLKNEEKENHLTICKTADAYQKITERN